MGKWSGHSLQHQWPNLIFQLISDWSIYCNDNSINLNNICLDLKMHWPWLLHNRKRGVSRRVNIKYWCQVVTIQGVCFKISGTSAYSKIMVKIVKNCYYIALSLHFSFYKVFYRNWYIRKYCLLWILRHLTNFSRANFTVKYSVSTDHFIKSVLILRHFSSKEVIKSQMECILYVIWFSVTREVILIYYLLILVCFWNMNSPTGRPNIYPIWGRKNLETFSSF